MEKTKCSLIEPKVKNRSCSFDTETQFIGHSRGREERVLFFIAPKSLKKYVYTHTHTQFRKA